MWVESMLLFTWSLVTMRVPREQTRARAAMVELAWLWPRSNLSGFSSDVSGETIAETSIRCAFWTRRSRIVELAAATAIRCSQKTQPSPAIEGPIDILPPISGLHPIGCASAKQAKAAMALSPKKPEANQARSFARPRGLHKSWVIIWIVSRTPDCTFLGR